MIILEIDEIETDSFVEERFRGENKGVAGIVMSGDKIVGQIIVKVIFDFGSLNEDNGTYSSSYTPKE